MCSCSGSTPQSSDSDYAKVKKAFDGVESSFKSTQQANLARLAPRYAINEGPSSSLQAIDELIQSTGENRGDTIDDLKYGQPPMIQFQCLKNVFEATGESFKFSNKYYDTINGDLYFDLNTGEAKSSEDGEEYHYTYNFELGLGVMFSDDLITADISFDIGINQGNDHYNVSWFVKMYLDYDFDAESPTYTLLMLSENEKMDLPFHLGVTYEYDYVKVNSNKINEWRKLFYETDQKLARDASHPSFDSYKDIVTYTTGNHSWYKNENLKKVQDNENKLAFARELFNLGLNSTDIKKESYFTGEGERNSKVSDMYRSFSQVFRKDLIYPLMTDYEIEEDDDDEGQQQEDPRVTSIRFFDKDTQSGFDNHTCTNEHHEITFRDLFLENGNAWRGDKLPDICLMDENNLLLSRETDLNQFKIFITYDNDTFEVSFGDFVSTIFKGASTSHGDYQLSLTLKLKSNENVQGSMNVTFDYYNGEGGLVDTTIDCIGIDGGGSFSITEDIKVKDLFLSDGTHKEYNDDTGGVDVVNNYKFIYRNKSGQTISEIPLEDITFGVKDNDESVTEYTFDESYADTKYSDLWYNVISNYSDYDGLCMAAKVNNADLGKEHSQCTFYVTVKRDGGDIPLAPIIKNLWPTKPIESRGFTDLLPCVNPSQSIYDGEKDKYFFYFDSSNTWASMTVRLTNDEKEAYIASIENDYGYTYNGTYKGGYGSMIMEFIKDGARLTFDLGSVDSEDPYNVTVYKDPGKVVPTSLSIDDVVLPYYDYGYTIREVLSVKGISEEDKKNLILDFSFEDGNDAYSLKDPGSYKITVLIRYSGDSQYFDRRLTVTIDIQPAS